MKSEVNRLVFLTVLLSFLLTPGQAQTPVRIAVDLMGERRPVSPYLYGRNNSLSDNPAQPLSDAQWQLLRDAGVTMFREGGGNNSTKYNWRRKLSSHPDWYNNVYSHDWDFAARSLQENIPTAQGLWTFQLIGKAAKTSQFNFNDWNYNHSQWWSGVTQNLAGGGTPNPAGGEKALVEGNPALYLEDWPADSVTGILDHWLGRDGLGLDKSKLVYWNMDNEPEIWNGTHDDIMPVLISAEAFMQRYFDLAKKVRQKFPEVKIVGPVPANEWQWYNWNGDKISYQGKSYVWLEYFIKRVAEEQQSTGIRLLDVLDIHFYPGETNPADIVQLHRVFFDRNYNYPGANGVKRSGAGAWDASLTKEFIFGRCSDWLVQYMGSNHGVTFSVTETDINSSNANVRAVWYASVLGEFARQGVEIFTPWGWKPGMWEVLHLFSRYNREIFLRADSDQEELVSAYPTVSHRGDSLTVVLVNRSLSETRTVQLTLSNTTVSQDPAAFLRLSNLPAAETFVSHRQNALQQGTVSPAGNVFTLTLPPLSVTSLQAGVKTLSADRVPFSGKPVLTVFPNPAKDICQVNFSVNEPGPAVVTVLNAAGSQVFGRQFATGVAGEHTCRFSTEDWPQGFYLVRVTTHAGQNTVKLSVTK